MDPNGQSRKRRKEATQPAKPPIRIPRDRKGDKKSAEATARDDGTTSPSVSGRVRAESSSTEAAKAARHGDSDGSDGRRTAAEEELAAATRMTVTNVGKGGKLYLRPSRMTLPKLSNLPATPPATSEGESTATRNSDSAAGHNHLRSAAVAADGGMLQPSMSPQGLGRTRSHSFSSTSNHRRVPTLDASDFYGMLGETESQKRPKSFVDMHAGLLDLQIPDHRLGSPRFSERGTAYMRDSIHRVPSQAPSSSTRDAVAVSRMFPMSPMRGTPSMSSRQSMSSNPFRPVHARAMTSSRIPIDLSTFSMLEPISPETFERLEANPNDPAVVHCHPLTGRIVAATPARLIAQITSPQFLDYELLSDFFLTFRSFMSCQDVLEYLLARMRWAFENRSDSGRIVRVRTFVALRHWILNYFPDDFLLDNAFRERFCELVNGMSASLIKRSDRGGSDMKILSELKKCWQRTCALYWPGPDPAQNMPLEAHITPGGERQMLPFGPSVLSLPLTIRPATHGGSSIFEVTQMPLAGPSNVGSQPRYKDKSAINRADAPPSPALARIPSIPTSPMSERSLEVLSCSVPFLQHLRTRERPGSSAKRLNSPLHGGGASQAAQGHDRGGSFSDALRDGRSPFASKHEGGIDLPAFTVSGGLVRGILLQPCPSTLNLAVPISPTEDDESRSSEGPDSPVVERPAERQAERQPPNKSVKKIVGLTRRALSVRKARSELPVRSHRPTQSSSDILQSGRNTPTATERKLPIKQHLPGPPRLDVLAERVETAYQESLNHVDASEADANSVEAPRPLFTPVKNAQTAHAQNANDSWNARNVRQDSNLTTSSRSILIVDATGAPELPQVSGGLSDMSSMSSVLAPEPFINNVAYPERFMQHVSRAGTDLPLHGYGVGYTADDDDQWRTSDAHLGDFLSVPGSSSIPAGSLLADSRLPSEDFTPRKSSIIHPPNLGLPTAQQNLRRRPGGDLKAADNVHDLAPQRPFSEATFSTNPRSVGTSALFTRDPSRNPSRAHFPSQFQGSANVPPAAPDPPKASQDVSGIQSTQVHVRRSFEADALRLRALPDADSDGGIEDALLKLEGKIPSPSHSSFSSKDRNEPPHSPTPKPSKLAQVELVESDHLDGSTAVEDRGQSPTMTETQGASIYNVSDSIGRSNASRIDLLKFDKLPTQRQDLGRLTTSSAQMARISDFPIQRPFLEASPQSVTSTPHYEQHTSGKIDDDKEEITLKFDPGTVHNMTQPVLSSNAEESQSDISTEIADQPEDDPGARSLYFNDTTEDRVRRYQQSRSQARADPRVPLTPPSTDPSAKTSEDRPGKHSEHKPHQKVLPSHLEDRPLKEVASAPKLRSPPPDRPLPRPPTGQLRRIHTSPAAQPPAHMPFVLAFESHVIAEQLTIIEKDALDEIDWKDLIGLNWQQHPPLIRNWVEYLKMEASNGIDVVIARHNLAVKWIVSEILLTHAPSERARAVTKYVHVANHCHRLRNFASMYQIILALLCPDLMRLHKTWTLVALREKQMLSELEALCQPVRNFTNLRTEMENVDPNTGCIPFIGLYTHDLMFNAQKPSRLEPVASGKEPLINFERYQTAATIVKGLLRMIEASSKYTLKPQPEALSRCLWIAALDDREIVARSKALETT